MSRPAFVDISVFQPLAIDFVAYRAWSAATDGIARLALKSTEGAGFTDPHFQAYRQAALAAGIDCLIFYHFSRPDLSGNSPQKEAAWQAQVLGGVRPTDIIMLDAETAPVSAEWCYEWLVAQQKNYPNNQIILYSFPAFIAQHLQDSRLAAFPLALASWQYSPDETPPCPAPWTSYAYIQWTDRATTIPGIPGTVDADVYLETKGSPPVSIPQGWKDDGTTLTAPNGMAVRNGFRVFVLSNAWNPDDYPLGPEVAVATLEMSNPSLGGGTQQMFRCSMLGWNAQLGVIHEWIGTELLAMRVALSAAQAALKDAQTQLQQCKTTLQVTGQQLAQAQSALNASGDYGKAVNDIADRIRTLPRYPAT